MIDSLRWLWPWSAMLPLLIVALFAGSLQGYSSELLPGDRNAGRRLAEGVCSECHGVSADGGISMNRFAPRFLDVANQPSTTALGLRVFLQSPHRRMPNLILTHKERDDVIAYILSLRQKSRPKL